MRTIRSLIAIAVLSALVTACSDGPDGREADFGSGSVVRDARVRGGLVLPTDAGPPGSDAGDAGASDGTVPEDALTEQDADSFSPDRADRELDALPADALALPPPDDGIVDGPDEGTQGQDGALTRLGEPCLRAADCETGVCIAQVIAGVEHALCTYLCCGEGECPAGYGCLQTGGGGLRFCMPSEVFPPGYTFDARAGDSCGAQDIACKSGICDSGRDTCLGSCCTDADCGGLTCAWAETAGGLRTFCDPLAVGFGRQGDPCFDETDCEAGICVPEDPGALEGECAEPCCSEASCPNGYQCGQVAGPNFPARIEVVSACVALPRGATPDGDACQNGEDCQSGICAEAVCRQPCCHDADCAGGGLCRPRSGDGAPIRVCV